MHASKQAMHASFLITLVKIVLTHASKYASIKFKLRVLLNCNFTYHVWHHVCFRMEKDNICSGNHHLHMTGLSTIRVISCVHTGVKGMVFQAWMHDNG